MQVVGIYILTMVFESLTLWGMLNMGWIFIDEPLFFRGVKLIVFCGLLGIWLGIKIRKRMGWGGLTLERVVTATVVVMSLNLVFLVVVPVTLDRSVTVHLLEKLNNSNVPISKTDLKVDLIENYVKRDRAVERRIGEQKLTGFVEEKNGNVALTEKGKLFLKFSKIVGRLYGL